MNTSLKHLQSRESKIYIKNIKLRDDKYILSFFRTCKLENLAYNVPIAKTYLLICWVSKRIKLASGEFILTNELELYNYYKIDIEKINPTALMSELTFYKEI